jgi:hypothetical protein
MKTPAGVNAIFPLMPDPYMPFFCAGPTNEPPVD